MHESIKKFLSFRISSKSLEEFNRNTAMVTSFIVELESLENAISSFDGLNKDKYNELQSKYTQVNNKYNAMKELFSKDQEILGRLLSINHELERYSKVIDFGSLLGNLKEKLNNLSDIDSIVREYNELKTIYDRSHELIEKNERVVSEYQIVSEKINYLSTNKEYLKEVINDINSLSINDDNFNSLLDKFIAHQEKLEELNDDVILPKVNEIVELLNSYGAELEKVVALQSKIQYILNKIPSDDWGKRKYLSDLRNIKTGFTAEYGVLFLTKKSFITSAACAACLAKINELQEKIDEVDEAIKQSRKIYDILDEIARLTDSVVIDARINEAKNKYKNFKYKDRFKGLEADIKDYEKDVRKNIQKAVLKEIQRIEGKIFASNASSLTEVTLKGYKKKVHDSYDLLDSENKAKVNYLQITSRIKKLLRDISRRDLHDSSEWYYLLIFGISAALLVGFYFYNRNIGIAPVKWLFNNPPYFGHKWQNWIANPWKWVQSVNVKDLLSFLWLIVVFVAAVVCCLVCLIAEVLWFLITVIAFGVSWLILTILSIVLHLLMYGFPGVVVIIAIILTVYNKIDNIIKSPTWMIVTILLLVALGTVSYLNMFGVLKF